MVLKCPKCFSVVFSPRDIEIIKVLECETCGVYLSPYQNEEGDWRLKEIDKAIIKPVQWTEDGCPVFTDPAQFQKWEAQCLQQLSEELSDVLNAEAVKIAVLAVESREAFIIEEIKRLAAQIENVELSVDAKLKMVDRIINET